MKMLPAPFKTSRPFRRAILATAILPAILASSAFGVTNWNGPVALSTSAAPDDIIVQSTSTVTLSDGGPTSITETSITFQPLVGNLETLTVNGPGLTLRSLTTALAIASTKTITINGTADFAPGSLNTTTSGGPALTGIFLVKNGGTGTLIIDDFTSLNNLAGTTLRTLDGRISVFGGGGTANPLSTLIPSIELGASTPAQTTQVPILRFVGDSVTDTIFANNFKAFYNSTIEHFGTTNDTISSTSGTNGIATGKTLTVNVAEGGLNIAGIVASTSSGSVKGGILKKTGVGTTLTLSGGAFISSINVAEGRVDVPGRFRSDIVTFGAGSTLSLRNTSTLAGTTNILPATTDVTLGSTLEGLPGNFSTASGQSTLKLSGGTLNLGLGGASSGLSVHLYNGDSTGAASAFNTFANFSAYFAGRGAGLLTSSGANGITELSYAPGGGDTAMFAPIAPTYTARDQIVARFNGKIIISGAGTYTFGTTTDDGSMLYIDGKTVVSNNFSQAATRRSGTVNLGPGLHDIEIGYYEGGGLNSMTVDYAGPDNGDAQTIIANSILLPSSDSLVFANPVIATESSTINTSGATVTSMALGASKTLNVNGRLDMGPVTLGVTAGAPTPTAGTYVFNANTQYAQVIARSIADGGLAVNLVNNGLGMLVLESGALAQLQNVSSSVTISNGELGVVLGGAGGSPTGNAAVNVNGRSLTMSSKGGDQTYTPTGLSFTNGGSINAAQIGSGVAGTVATPIRTTLTTALSVNAGNTLSTSSQDNYILRIGGVGGGGSLNVLRGAVESTGPVNLTGNGQLTVGFSSLSTLAGASARAIALSNGSITNTGTLNSVTNFTVSDSTVSSTGAVSAGGAMTLTNATLTSGGLLTATGGLTATTSTITASAGTTAASIALTGSTLINTGVLTTGAGGITLTGGSNASTLELHGGSISGGAIAGAGGTIHVTTGLTTAATSASFTEVSSNGLKGRFITTGVPGRAYPGNTQAGILANETLPGVERVLTSALSFGPQGQADGVISAFFGGVSTEPNEFAMGFFGNFKAPASGLFSFQTGIVDDDAGIWLDLDGNGIFQTTGAAGNELVAQGGCCGDGPVGTVTLVQNHIYKVGIGVDDGQGGSSLEARFALPGESMQVVNPGDALQSGYWTIGQPNQVIVDSGAELDIRSIDGSVNVTANGKLDLRGPGSDTITSLVIGDGGIVTLGGPALAPAAAALAVPEPGSIGLLLLGVTGLLSRRVRARRS